ncbi:MAG: CPBP family intramembrane metalloprotease [Planctomycetaceae bacterium]|nr:CPBP family intramembrane metalloprotease [Planctomycetaceae bacterium]
MSTTLQQENSWQATPPAPRGDLLAVIAAMLFPSLATWLYFVAFAGHEAMHAVYSTVKVLQFAFPLLWVIGLRKRWPKPGWPGRAAVATGLVLGLVITAAMLFAYQSLLTHTPWLDAPIEQIRAKVAEMGLNTPLRFAALALFYSVIHSFLEEYYWRWYVFGELRRFTGDAAAIGLSSLGFMAHHVIVLGLYFGESWWLTVLLSLSVAVGGGLWAWLYRRSGSLVGPWLSHALVDAGIMAIGYLMIRGS